MNTDNQYVPIIVAVITGAAAIIAAIITAWRRKEAKKRPDANIKTRIRAKSGVIISDNNFGVQTKEGNSENGAQKKN